LIKKTRDLSVKGAGREDGGKVLAKPGSENQKRSIQPATSVEKKNCGRIEKLSSFREGKT